MCAFKYRLNMIKTCDMAHYKDTKQTQWAPVDYK